MIYLPFTNLQAVPKLWIGESMGKGLLFWGCLVFFLLSCQTEELNRLKSENESLRRDLSICKSEETELRRKERDLVGRINSLETELKELREAGEKLTKENEARKNRILQLERELAILKEDHQYLSRILEELRFTAQSNSREKAPLETGQKGWEDRSGLRKLRHPDGRIEYFDASVSSLDSQSMFLSIEEKPDGTLSLYLNIQHGYWVIRKDYSVVGIAISKGGKTLSIPYSLSDVYAVEQGGFRKEILRLPVKGKILDILKELAEGESEIRILIAFPDFSQDRVLSRLEVQGMGNVYYAFREMGGSL